MSLFTIRVYVGSSISATGPKYTLEVDTGEINYIFGFVSAIEKIANALANAVDQNKTGEKERLVNSELEEVGDKE